MYKYTRCLYSIVLFCIFITISVPALADDIAVPINDYTQQELEDGVYTGSDGLSVYLDGVEQDNDLSTYGTISDQSNMLAVGYDVYSTTFNWRTEEQFIPTADIGYTKAFADSVINSALADTQVNTLDTAEQVFKGIIGETIILHYEDDNGNSTLPENSKISLDLSFDDSSLEYSSSTWANARWSRTSPYSYQGVEHSGNRINAATNLLNFQSAKWFDSSGSKMYYGNTITVFTLDTDGNQETLGTYTDTSSINVTFTSPGDVIAVYIDVQYDMNGGSFSSYGTIYQLPFPAIFKLSLSGNISVDTSGVNTGLLKSIIQWLRNILNAITALPQQIADLVVNGIKSLFVPSADDLQPKFQEFQNVAYSKLGFVYQVATDFVTLIQEFFNATVSPTTTLTIPQIALPWDKVDGGQMILLQETTFSVFPENLEVLRTLCKTVTSMLLVLYFYRSVLEAFEKFFKE